MFILFIVQKKRNNLVRIYILLLV